MSVLYEQPARITYYDLDRFGCLKLSALLRLAHIAADINAKDLGCGFSHLTPLSMSFVLQRFGLYTSEMPEYDQTVIIRTWPADIARGTFLRHGDMKDRHGRRLMEWTSLWVLLDLNARRILRPSALPAPFTGMGSLGVTTEAKKIDVSETWGEEISAHTHTVRHSEVDTNGHMNNTFYGDLIEDAVYGDSDSHCFKAGPFEAERYAEMQLNYLSETRLNDTIDIRCRHKDGQYQVRGMADGKMSFLGWLK